MAAHKDVVPYKLRTKVPPLLHMFVELRTFWTLSSVGIAAFLLYGPIAGPYAPDHNGLRYLLAPWICPWGAVVWYWFVPFNPYGRGSVSQFAGMIDYDKRDPDAQRLVALFRSPEARRAVVRITLRISVLLFVIMALITVALRHALHWSLFSYWLRPGLMGGAITASNAVGSEYVYWGVTRWAQSYSEGDQPSP